jgi:serine/threonine protein kinase
LNLNNSEHLRLFNQEGLEIYEEDMKFLTNKEVLYVSKGEDFNVNTYYSEYAIVKILGQGGFGKVYLATHKKTVEKVAIKITNAGGINNSDEIESIFSEAETVKALNHPNIVKIINFFVIKKTLQTYFIMEYLEGGELLRFLEEKKRLSETEAHEIFRQIISAIDYCHRQKIIHRDLKLENIMKVDQNSLNIKIVDFGIAGLFAGRKSEVTRAGSLFYMAPEVLSKKNLIASPAMDIWSVGCILYALVVGTLPFQDKSEINLAKKIIESDVEIPKALKLSPELTDLIEQMLHKNAERRIKMAEIKQHPWFLKTKL